MLLQEPMKNRVFAVSQCWVDKFNTYFSNLQSKDDEAVKPGPIDNFDLVYLSPKYQEQMNVADK